MHPKTTVFLDVDTQRDFLLPNGELSVAGADRIILKLAEVTNLARELGIRIIASVDCHLPTDHELQRNGGEYPDHCMASTEGQKKIDATAPRNPLYIPTHELTLHQIKTALAHQGETIFEKQLFDVFAGNPNTNTLLPVLLKTCEDLVVYGVYTEVCVRDAIAGLLKMGPRLHVLTDATADIGAEGHAHRARWQTQGVELLTVNELKSRLQDNQ